MPEKVFRRVENSTGPPAPVMVNIHGGGFFIGDKATLYPPQGLLAAADNEMVYVSMNYRVSLRRRSRSSSQSPASYSPLAIVH